MTRLFKPLALVLLAVALAAGGGARAGHLAGKVEISDIVVGDGAEATRHAKVTVHYTGWLADGTKFDSSRDRGTPFSFTIGGGQVIPGWDVGVAGMRTGGKRELVIPPELAYGRAGAGSTIPPDATLRFEVELLAVTPPRYTNIGNAALKALLEKGTRVVDLRRQDEWEKTGVIEGSDRLTAFDANGRFIRSFPGAFRRLVEPDEEVIVICQRGNRSAAIANLLTEKAGYTKVYNVTDGMARWIEEGNPVAR